MWFKKSESEVTAPIVRIASVQPKLTIKVGGIDLEGDLKSLCLGVRRNVFSAYGRMGYVHVDVPTELAHLIEALTTYRDLVAQAKKAGAA